MERPASEAQLKVAAELEQLARRIRAGAIHVETVLEERRIEWLPATIHGNRIIGKRITINTRDE